MGNIEWFKETIEPLLKEYEVTYRSFKDGDFGDLESVEFNGDKLCGGVEFWSSGMLGIDLLDLASGEDLMNVLVNGEDSGEKARKLEELISVLKAHS
jgi:hypothetical protein